MSLVVQNRLRGDLDLTGVLIGETSIQIPSVVRKVGRTDFQANPVSRPQFGGGITKVDFVLVRLAWSDEVGRRFRSLPIASAHYTVDHIMGVAVGMDVDNLGSEIGVAC